MWATSLPPGLSFPDAVNRGESAFSGFVRQGASDLFVNVHLGTEQHSFIVSDLGNRTAITRDLRLESAHFILQSASFRKNQRLHRLNGIKFEKSA